MKWWLISLLLLGAFGPIFWLVPSRRDRRLAAMREQARVRGISVELTRLPDLNPKSEDRVSAAGLELEPTLSCVAYRLPYGRTLSLAPVWQLQRDSRVSEGLLPGWRLTGERPGSESYQAAIAALVPHLPEDCLALECDTHRVSFYWTEAVSKDLALAAVEKVANILEKIKQIQIVSEEEKELKQAQYE